MKSFKNGWWQLAFLWRQPPAIMNELWATTENSYLQAVWQTQVELCSADGWENSSGSQNLCLSQHWQVLEESPFGDTPLFSHRVIGLTEREKDVK